MFIKRSYVRSLSLYVDDIVVIDNDDWCNGNGSTQTCLAKEFEIKDLGPSGMSYWVLTLNWVKDVQDFANILGCHIGSWPSTYWGLPLGSRFKPTKAWDSVISKYHNRLTRWKSLYSLKGTRVTLISSTFCKHSDLFYVSSPNLNRHEEKVGKDRKRFPMERGWSWLQISLG